MAKRHYDDLSFILQALDNTGTIYQVDRHLLDDWALERLISRYDENEAADLLSRAIVYLQLEGKLIQCGSSSDSITIHKDEYAFIAQFFTDARDNDNRPAPVVCFGRLPRAGYERAGDRGISLLRSFLKENGIEWRASIKQRYWVMCRELEKASESGFRLSVPRPSWPNLRIPGIQRGAPEEEKVVRLGGRSFRETAEDSSEDRKAASSGGREGPAAAHGNEKLRDSSPAPTPATDDVSDTNAAVAHADDEKEPNDDRADDRPPPAGGSSIPQDG